MRILRTKSAAFLMDGKAIICSVPYTTLKRAGLKFDGETPVPSVWQQDQVRLTRTKYHWKCPNNPPWEG